MKKFHGATLLVALMCAFVGNRSASANVGQDFGFGSATAGRAGAGVAWGFDGFSAYSNPAGLSVEKEKRLLFSWGLLYMQPNFTPISNVVTENNFRSDAPVGTPVYGNVDVSYKATFGQEIGIGYRLFPDTYNLTLGLVAFMPVSQVAYMDTGEAYIPEYILYRARTQRPQFELGLGADLGNGFHVGAGAHIAFALTGNASVFLNTQAGTASSMRFISSLTPKAAPYLGVLYAGTESEHPWTLGGVFRFPVTSNNTMQLNSAARVFGNFAAVDFNFTALSALFYDPMAIELGGSWAIVSGFRSFAQLEYQFWSRFEAPALLIQQPQTTSGSVTIAAGSVPNYQYSNILVPRVGGEIDLSSSSVLRFGYSFRRSILTDVPNGPGNYLDPSKHIMTLGMGFKSDSFLGYAIANHLDFHLSYQMLLTQTIVKTAGNEAGNASDLKIGAPGYNAGGNLVGGGVSFSLAL